jgi:hypothetical protein
VDASDRERGRHETDAESSADRFPHAALIVSALRERVRDADTRVPPPAPTPATLPAPSSGPKAIFERRRLARDVDPSLVDQPGKKTTRRTSIQVLFSRSLGGRSPVKRWIVGSRNR